MAAHGLHRGLELRLEALAERIAALRHKMRHTKRVERIQEFSEIKELEKRYSVLTERLRRLNSEGPGFMQNVKAELEKMADDLSATIEDFAMRVDTEHMRTLGRTRRRKP